MFGSTILEMAIGLALIYLLLSLICSVINELFAGIFDRRALHLEEGIAALLRDPALHARFYAHPLIRSLTIAGKLPAYIPSRTFVLTLLDVIGPGASGELQTIQQQIADMQNKELARILAVLAIQAKTAEHLARNIEDWFNRSMDAVSSTYKKRTQAVLLAMAALVAIGLNVDTLKILDRVSRDSVLRASLVAQAEAVAKAPAPAATAGDTASRVKDLEQSVNRVQSLGLPIGWTEPFSIPGTLGHVPGWIITALAVSLGAPFWFDLLNKFMVVRSAIKPHEKSSETPSKD
jgi:hypothetical protein